MKEPELKNVREYNFTRSWLSVFRNAVDNFDENNSDLHPRHFKTRKIKLGSLKHRVRKLEEEVNEYEQYHPWNARLNKIRVRLLALASLRSLNAYHEERILQATRSQESRETSYPTSRNQNGRAESSPDNQTEQSC